MEKGDVIKKLDEDFPSTETDKLIRQKGQIIEQAKFNKLSSFVKLEVTRILDGISNTIKKGIPITNFPDIQKIQDVDTEKNVKLVNYEDLSAALKKQLLELIPLDVVIQNLELDVKNFPKSFDISNLPAKQLVEGTINIANLPNIQEVKGKVSIQFPDVQKVSTDFPDVQKVKGKVKADVTFPKEQEVKINNFPLTQKIKGDVSVKFPKTQQVEVINDVKVKGKVEIDFPTIQKVKIDNITDLKELKINNFPKTQKVDGKVKLVPERDPKNYIPVRLTNGQEWMSQLIEVMGGGGGTFIPADFEDIDGNRRAALVDSDNHVQVDVLTMPDVTLNPGDIEIGAVEIKDGTTDERANVKSDGTNKALVVTQNNQPLPTGAATATKQDTIITNQTNATQKTQIVDGDGDVADVITTNGFKGLVAVAPGHISTDNSTIETLIADELFTGEWENITNFGVIVISITSNVGSAIDGLLVQFSSDGTVAGIISDDEFTVAAGAKKTFSFQAAAQYYRVVYTNGGILQLSFNLQTVLKPYYVKPSSHRIQDSIVDDDDAELNKSVLTGADSTGVFRNVKTTKAGILLVSDYLLEVAKGNVEGENIMNKFGENPSIGTGTDPEDIWDGGGIYAFYPTTAQSMEILSDDANDSGVAISTGTVTTTGIITLIDSAANFQTQATPVTVGDLVINDTTNQFGIIESVDSEIQLTLGGVMTNGSQENFQTSPNTVGDSYRVANANDTGAATIAIYGLDANWVSQTEIVVLNGQTAVDLTQTFIRVNRMVVLTAGTADGAEGILTCRIDGGGTTAAVINNGNNQTLMAIYTVPAGRTGHFLQGYVALSKGGGAATVGASYSWKARTFGGVFNIKGVMELNSSGSGWWQYKYAGAPGLPPKTDVIIRCEEVTATLGVVAGMDILLIDN